MNAIDLAERRWLPDLFIRLGIRRLLSKRLESEGRGDARRRKNRRAAVLKQLTSSPIAIASQAANQQHYTLPTEFFQKILGSHLKYSACYWPDPVKNLTQAEEAMLVLYNERAQLRNGQRVLELGCGWGSLTLWMASHFPDSHITAVSNSASQKAYIDSTAGRMGLKNVSVITEDVNHLTTDMRYDRIVTVEMLEHVRNYPRLLERIASWLKPEGLAFAHIFCHEKLVYPFDVKDKNDWMAQYFFTGGMMPSYDTFDEFQQHLRLLNRWRVSGEHYQKTAEAWLHNQDHNRAEILDILAQVYGPDAADLWFQRWRMFFMACSELFGYGGGSEWIIGHYLWGHR